MNAIITSLFWQFASESESGLSDGCEWKKGKLLKNPEVTVKIQEYHDTAEFWAYLQGGRPDQCFTLLKISALKSDECPDLNVVELAVSMERGLVNTALKICAQANILVGEFQQG